MGLFFREFSMSLIRTFECGNCGKYISEVFDGSGICSKCRIKTARQKRKVFLDNLRIKSLKKRVELIEEQLYDLDVDRRLKNIEVLNVQY